MFTHDTLAALMVVLTLQGQVHAGRIVGGHEAKSHSRPYMALLERHMDNGQTLFCGGFLLSEDFVMTAAHCKAKSFRVKLGLHSADDQNDKTQSITVEQSFPHKNYNGTSFKNDIMLLKLSCKVKFNDYVKPIELAGPDDGSLPKSCSVAGWGRTTWSDPYMNDKLMEVEVTLIKNENCENDNFYCSEGKTGPAQGDSGGPLVCKGNGNDTAYGVVSTMVTPDSNSASIFRYTKTTGHKDWIISAMKRALMKN